MWSTRRALCWTVAASRELASVFERGETTRIRTKNHSTKTKAEAVRSWNMTNMNFGQEFKIPVKNISEGNYVLKVETNTNSYNKKVIIKF